MKNISNVWQYILRETRPSYQFWKLKKIVWIFYFICGIFTFAINHYGRQISKKNNTSWNLLPCYSSYNNFLLNCRRLWVLVSFSYNLQDKVADQIFIPATSSSTHTFPMPPYRHYFILHVKRKGKNNISLQTLSIMYLYKANVRIVYDIFPYAHFPQQPVVLLTVWFGCLCF